MAEFATIARPYAKALYELASEKNQIEPWLDGLKELAWAVAQPKVSGLLEDSETSAVDKADFLVRLLTEQPAIRDTEFKNFVYVVAQEKRLQALPEIYTEYQSLVLAKNQCKRAVVYSAYPMSEGQFAKVVADFQKQFNTNLDASLEIDPELIGGIKVEVGDQVLDLSVQGKLQKLYTAMIN